MLPKEANIIQIQMAPSSCLSWQAAQVASADYKARYTSARPATRRVQV